MTERLWTIREFGKQVESALSQGYEAAANGQVRSVPDTRTIRYYTTLGLIDRPAAMRGRTALYGRRHLLQVVAVKRLQATGLSLAEVQTRLAGATDTMLTEVAGAVNGPSDTPSAPQGIAKTAMPTRAFWTDEPAPPAEAAMDDLVPETVADAARPMTGIPLGGDSTLLFTPARPLDEEDLRAVQEAAAPLLRFLKKRGLL